MFIAYRSWVLKLDSEAYVLCYFVLRVCENDRLELPKVYNFLDYSFRF